MTFPTFLFLAAFVFALIDEWRSRGEDVLGWAVALLALALVWDAFWRAVTPS